MLRRMGNQVLSIMALHYIQKKHLGQDLLNAHLCLGLITVFLLTLSTLVAIHFPWTQFIGPDLDLDFLSGNLGQYLSILGEQFTILLGAKSLFLMLSF